MQQNLNNLRQQIKKKLQALAPNLCLTASQKITAKIVTSKVFIHSKNIACYISIDNEIDIWPVIETIWHQEKNCYLPVCDAEIKNPLHFVKFSEHDELATTKYNIPEPKTCSPIFIEPQELDLVIVPLLGFNNNSFRLGRGAGCYDRTFAFKQHNPEIKPHLLGVGYKWQLVEFKPDPWDVAMDEVIAA